VRLWDAATGAPRLTLAGHTRGVNSVVWSPDGRAPASGDDNGTVRLWDARDGTLLTWFPCQDRVLALWFDPAGPYLHAADRGRADGRPRAYFLEIVKLPQDG